MIPTTMFSKRKTLNLQMSTPASQRQGTLHQLRLFQPLFSHEPGQPVAEPPNALLSTRGCGGIRPVTGPLKALKGCYNVAFCIKTSNKQTLSTFLEKLHSFPAQSTRELAHPTQQKHPPSVTKSQASSKPRLPQVAPGSWHQIELYAVPFKLHGKMSHLKLDYPKYCRQLRMIIITLPEIRHQTHPSLSGNSG